MATATASPPRCRAPTDGSNGLPRSNARRRTRMRDLLGSALASRFAPAGASDLTWRALRPFTRSIAAEDQVLLIAATGGAKSTPAAIETLGVGSLVAIDGKDSLYLPNATVYDLPKAPEWPARQTQFANDPGVLAF